MFSKTNPGFFHIKHVKQVLNPELILLPVLNPSYHYFSSCCSGILTEVAAK